MGSASTSRGGPAPPTIIITKKRMSPRPWAARAVGSKAPNATPMALKQATQREPTTAEVERGVQLMRALLEKDGLSAEGALKYFCVVALNLNEFVYLD